MDGLKRGMMSKVDTSGFKIMCPDCGADTYIGKYAIRTCTKCSWDAEKKQREELDRIRVEEWNKLSDEEREARTINYQKSLKNLAFMLPWLIQ
jgi:hypothetical protein